MPDCTVICHDQHQQPLAGVHVVLVAPNGTYLTAHSDEHGAAQLQLPDEQPGTLLLAHPSCSGQVIPDFRPSDQVHYTLHRHGHEPHGSVIFEQSTGSVPGLAGRLSPILDTAGRTYIYGDNVSFGDQPVQPAVFAVGKPLTAEDALRHRLTLEVKFILGRTSLIEYRGHAA